MRDEGTGSKIGNASRDVWPVARDILKHARNRGMQLTPMQLVKLAYIAHGFHLAMTDGEPLFNNPIQAWKYGPVIPDLYHLIKHHGKDPIPSEIIGGGELSFPDLENFLGGLVERYGVFDGIALSNLTHRNGTPWKQVYKKGQLGIKIPNELVQQHYKEALDAAR